MIKKNEFKDDFVTIGTIKEPFGVNGLVKVKIFCEDPKTLKNTKEFLLGKNQLSTKITLKRQIDRDIWLARLSAISSREQVLKYRGQNICCNKDFLPALNTNEYYYFDLIGLNIEISC